MTKHQFTTELTKALASIDPETRAEIMADMNDHFEEGINLGLSEEEICIKLGQPGQIAEQVIEELGAIKNQKSQSHHQYSHEADSGSFADSINSLVGGIGDLVGNIGNVVEDSLKNIDFGKFGDFSSFPFDNDNQQAEFGNFEPVVVDLRNMGETTRVRGGYDINIDKAFTDVRSLNVSLNLCSLKIAPAPQGESARVVIQGRSRYDNFLIENKNGCLTVIDRHPIFRFEVFGFKNTLKATILLPAGYDGNIKAKTSAGNITISNVCGNLDLNTAAGTILVDNHKCDTAHLRSSAGGIKLMGCVISDVNANSSAGAVYVEGREAGNLTLSSSAGTVKGLVNKIRGDVNMSSSAGGIRLEARDVQGNITAKSSAGSIHMRLPKEVNCRIELKKPSIGSVRNSLVGNPQSPYVLRATGSIGSITLEAIEA